MMTVRKAAERLSPAMAIALGSVVIVVTAAVIGASIGLSYLLTIHYVNQFAASQAAQNLKATKQAIQQAKPTCHELMQLANARAHTVFWHMHNPRSWENVVTNIFRGVFRTSHCVQILNGTYKSPQG